MIDGGMDLPVDSCFCKYRLKYGSQDRNASYISEISRCEQVRQRRTPEKIYKEQSDIPDNPRTVSRTNYKINENNLDKNKINVDILLEYKYVSPKQQYNMFYQFYNYYYHQSKSANQRK